MKTAFQRNPYKWLMVLILVLFLAGLFLPFKTFHGVFFDPEGRLMAPVVHYGWETLSFQLHFGVSMLILLVSLFSRIAFRLLLIRLLMLILILILVVTFFHDIQFMMGLPITSELNAAGYLSYTGVCLAWLFGLLHFRKSYPVYKRLLEEQKKQSSDLLDSF
jgi:hypothetical protein